MVQPTNGFIILGGTNPPAFVDANNDAIEWKKEDDGRFTTKEIVKPLGYDDKGKETGKVRYTYALVPDGKGNLVVSVNKQKELTKAGEKAGTEVSSPYANVKEENLPTSEKSSSFKKEDDLEEHRKYNKSK